VILLKASRYLLAVSATTSSVMATPSLPLRPEVVSQSRRYCWGVLALCLEHRDMEIETTTSDTYLVVG
jgi:hypothetical protein